MDPRLGGAAPSRCVLQGQFKFVSVLGLLISLLLILLPTTAGAQDAQPTAEEPPPFTISTLETVRTRGYLVCAASSLLPGFAQVSSEGLWSGFDVDLCRAVAAAVFGDPSRVEFRPLAGQARFAHLASGDVDLLARTAPWSMSRDTQYDVTYVGTSFFDGQAFMVPDRMDVVSAYELEDVRVCSASGSEEAIRLREFFFEEQVSYDEVNFEDREDLALTYRTGNCEALVGPASWLQSIRRTLPEPNTHHILPERLSKAPYGPVVRSDDEQWLTIVRWTLYALINAEEFGVTSVNIESMLAARTPAIRHLLGVEGDLGSRLGLRGTWMRDVIRSVGNYGELYERHFGGASGVPLLRGHNALWINGGLLYAPPLR